MVCMGGYWVRFSVRLCVLCSDFEWLEDVLVVVQVVVLFVGVLILDELWVDYFMLVVLKYELLVFGEVVGGLSDSVCQSVFDFFWLQFWGLCNVVIYEYFCVLFSIFYQVVIVDLFVLIF